MGSFIVFKPTRYQREEPTITLIKNAIRYNTSFVRAADIDRFNFVEYHIDEEGRRIGFRFYKEEKSPGTKMKLLPKRRRANSPISGYTSAAQELFSNYAWLYQRMRKKAWAERNIVVKKDLREKNLWVALFQPTFEHSVLIDQVHTIDKNLRGIYRYVNEDGEIVYIGKGRIYERYNEKGCEDWRVKEIQCVELPNEVQEYWETYYLDQFKEENGGRLPHYNRQSGKTHKLISE